MIAYIHPAMQPPTIPITPLTTNKTINNTLFKQINTYTNFLIFLSLQIFFNNFISP